MILESRAGQRKHVYLIDSPPVFTSSIGIDIRNSIHQITCLMSLFTSGQTRTEEILLSFLLVSLTVRIAFDIPPASDSINPLGKEGQLKNVSEI